MSTKELAFIKEAAAWRFPPATQVRLDDLLDRKTKLTQQELCELDALIALNDELSALKARALELLARRGERVA
jgi:uncharacterized protein YhaN